MNNDEDFKFDREAIKVEPNARHFHSCIRTTLSDACYEANNSNTNRNGHRHLRITAEQEQKIREGCTKGRKSKGLEG